MNTGFSLSYRYFLHKSSGTPKEEIPKIGWWFLTFSSKLTSPVFVRQ